MNSAAPYSHHVTKSCPFPEAMEAGINPSNATAIRMIVTNLTPSLRNKGTRGYREKQFFPLSHGPGRLKIHTRARARGTPPRDSLTCPGDRGV